MGAWIEMKVVVSPYINAPVAPHVGAWIEIDYVLCIAKSDRVAPHVGAWIEIYRFLSIILMMSRRTPRGCVD